MKTGNNHQFESTIFLRWRWHSPSACCCFCMAAWSDEIPFLCSGYAFSKFSSLQPYLKLEICEKRKVFMYENMILPFNKFQCDPSSLPILDTLPSWLMPFWIPIFQWNLMCLSQIPFVPVLDNLLPSMCSKCTTYLWHKELWGFRYVDLTWNGWGWRYLVSIERATQNVTWMRMYMWVFRCQWKFQCRFNVTRLVVYEWVIRTQITWDLPLQGL